MKLRLAATVLAAAAALIVPAVAAASCPAGGIDTTGMSGAELQVAGLRNDTAQACVQAVDVVNNLHDDLFVIVGAIAGAALVPSILRVLAAER